MTVEHVALGFLLTSAGMFAAIAFSELLERYHWRSRDEERELLSFKLNPRIIKAAESMRASWRHSSRFSRNLYDPDVEESIHYFDYETAKILCRTRKRKAFEEGLGDREEMYARYEELIESRESGQDEWNERGLGMIKKHIGMLPISRARQTDMQPINRNGDGAEGSIEELELPVSRYESSDRISLN